MKWIYNPNKSELINTDTGSMIFLYSWDWANSALYDYGVTFRGPAGGYSPQTEGVESHESELFSGTKAECETYIRDLAGQFAAVALPEGNGTPRPKKEDKPQPEPVYVPADYSDQCSSDIPF